MNHILEVILKILYRLAMPLESDSDYFSAAFYQKLVYNNWIYDMAKLFDIGAIYGQSNPEVVKEIVFSVFENDKRYV